MAGIGDLYYTFRGDGARLKADAQKAGAQAGDVGSRSFAGRFKSGLRGALGGSKDAIMGGLGLGVGLGAVGVATVAVGKLTEVMGDAVRAAIEEESSIAKLDAALRANVKGYDGNTAAIEKTLAARMRLGFADDEQRESLALLVAATKDETKALTIQRAAMDLARLKRISLQEASEALIKVEGGQFRILKSLGIQLRKGATATEALAAVQAAAAGQAEAFADSNEGRLLASQIRVGEALEKLGARVLPMVVAATEGATDVVEDLALGLEALGKTLDIITTGELPRTEKETIELADALLGLAAILPGVSGVANGLRGPLHDLGEESIRAADNIDFMKDATKDDLAVVALSLDDVGDEATTTATRVDRATGRMITSVDDLRSATIAAAQDIVTKAYQVIEDKAALTAVNVEKAELRKAIAAGTATREQKARYRELTEEQERLVLSLAENGAEGSKQVKEAIVQLKKDLKTAQGPERAAIAATIAALEELETQAKNTAAATRRAWKRPTQGGNVGGRVVGTPHRATGGQVARGAPVVWSEPRMPEVFLPNVSGRIAAMPEIRAAVAATGGATGGAQDNSVTVNIGQATRQTAAAIHREMQMIQGARRLKGTLGTPRG